METISYEDDNLKININYENEQLCLLLTDAKSGEDLGRTPLVQLEIHDRALTRTEKKTRYRLDRLANVDNGIHAIVGDPQSKIDLGIWIRLVNGELSLMVSPPEIYERDRDLYRLYAVNLLPELMTVTGENGRILLPINTGMITSPFSKPKLSDQFLIYGEQERWEITPSLPVCACYDGECGFVAVATQGACDARCFIETDGAGKGSTGFAVTFRREWIDPVDMTNREIRYLPIPEQQDLLRFSAKRLRQHVMDDLGKRTLRERAEESEDVKFLLYAYIMKLFFAVENVGYMMEGKEKGDPVSFQNLMTFAEAKKCLSQLHDIGVPNVLTQCVGWNSRGHDGMYPMRFPIDERLGGEAGFRDLITAGNAMGYNIQVHDNFIMNCLDSPEFDVDYVIHDKYGVPLPHGRWAGGIEFSGWPLAFPEKMLQGHMQKMKGLGLKGMYYVDYMEQPLEVNYHPKHGGPRSHCAKGQALIVEEGRRVFGACGTEFGFLPCAIPADHVATCGEPHHIKRFLDEWPVTQLLDEIVPLWQMTMSGLIVTEARWGTSWENVLQCVLYGRIPRDEWSVRPGVMPVFDRKRAEQHKAIHDICIDRFGHLKLHEIVDYRQEAPDVHQTVFDDGTEVRADFNRKELLVNGESVAKPEIL